MARYIINTSKGDIPPKKKAIQVKGSEVITYNREYTKEYNNFPRTISEGFNSVVIRSSKVFFSFSPDMAPHVKEGQRIAIRKNCK